MLWLRQKVNLDTNRPKTESRLKRFFKKTQSIRQTGIKVKVAAAAAVATPQRDVARDKSDLYAVVPYPSPHPSVQIKALRESLSTVVPPKPPSTHLRIKAKETHDQLLTPHRSPPSHPYTPTSTTSSSITTSSPGQTYSAFASIDEEDATDLHNDTENTSFTAAVDEEEESHEKQKQHDPNLFASAPSQVRASDLSFIPSRNPARNRVPARSIRESLLRDDTSSIYAPSVRAPSVRTPSIRAPSIRAPSIRAPSIRAPSIRAPSIGRSSTVSPVQNPYAVSRVGANLPNASSDSVTTTGDETWFHQRTSVRARSKTRISGIAPQQFKATPLSRKGPHDFAIPVRRRPVMGQTGDSELVRSATTKSSRRISVASSLSSILPYIIRYNDLSAEDVSQPRKPSPEIDISGIQDTFTTVEHVEQVETPNIYEQNRRIEQLLQRRATPPPVQPLCIRKPDAASVPCQAGVEEYAQQLDLEFKQFEGVEPDYQFREQILRGTSYSVRRRSRILDKDLPALPFSGDRPKRLNTLRGKFKLFV